MAIDCPGHSDNGPSKQVIEKGSLVRDLSTAKGIEQLRFYEIPPRNHENRDFLDAAIAWGDKSLWQFKRKNAGFNGDCRYIWEKVLDMPLKELIEKRDDIVIPPDSEIDDDYLCPIKDETTAEVLTAQREKIRAAHDKYDLTHFRGIRRHAERLSHKDLTAIREWGSEVSRIRTQAFKELHDENMRISLQASTRAAQILKDLSALVKAQRPPSKLSIRNAFFVAKTKVVTPRQKDYFLEDGETAPKRRKDRLIDYRLMDEEQKKTREDFLLQALEDGFSTEMGKEEARTVFAERAQEQVDMYLTLMIQYQKALKANRTRIIEEEQADLAGSHNHGDDDVKEQFTRAASRVHDDIDNTLESLQEVIDACSHEYDHYITCMALHKKNKRQMRGVINDSIERVRRHSRMAQRVMLEQNVMLAGEFAKGLDRYDLEKQLRIATARIRKSMFKEVDELIKMQKRMVGDEALVLDYKEPAALLEDKREILLLVAPEKVKAPEPQEL